MGNRIKKYVLVFLPFLIFLTGFSGFYIRAEADGYSSWIQDTETYKEFYRNASVNAGTVNAPAEEEEEGFLVQQLGNLIHWIGTSLAKLLSGSTVNLSIDGLILGKIASPLGVSYTSFYLTDKNPYGIVGATIYTVLRGFSYSGLFIVFLYLLARQMVVGGSKARDELKQGIYGIVLSFLLIYLIPKVADLLIFIRDGLVYKVAVYLSGGTSIVDTMDRAYKAEPTLIMAVVYTATIGASVAYLADYISIAIQETLLFGFFPVFNLLGSQKKKFLSDWTALFVSNMFIPLFDAVCLLLPYMTIQASGGRTVSFGQALIIMFQIWSAKAARGQIMKLFGGMTGTPAGRGLGGLALMAQAARMARNAGRGAIRDHNTGSGDSYSDWKKEEELLESRSKDMNHQAEEIKNGIKDVDEFMTDRDSSEKLDEEELLGGSGIGDSSNPAEDGYDTVSNEELEDEREKEPEFEQGMIDSIDGNADYAEVQGNSESGMGAEYVQQNDPDLAQGADDYEEMADRQEDISSEQPDAKGNEDENLSAASYMGDAGETRENFLDDGLGSDRSVNGDLEWKDPAMSGFDRERLQNLEELDRANTRIASEYKSIDDLKSQNAAYDGDIQNLKNGEFAMNRTELTDIDKLNKENASIDERIAEIRNGMGKNGEDIGALTVRNAQIDHDLQDLELKGKAEKSKDVTDRIDSLKQERAQNNMKIATAQSDTGKEIAELNAMRAHNSAKIGEAQSRISARHTEVERKIGEIQANKARNNLSISKHESRISDYERITDERRKAEVRFANVSKANGLDGTRYGDAKEMRAALSTRQMKQERLLDEARKKASLSIEDIKGLSPDAAAEIARLQRDHIRKDNLLKAAGVITKATAKTAGAVIGATAFGTLVSYGGEQAALNGAMVGGLLGGGVVDKTVNTVKKAGENSEQFLDVANKANGKKQDPEIPSAGKQSGRRKRTRRSRQKEPYYGKSKSQTMEMEQKPISETDEGVAQVLKTLGEQEN